MLNLHRLSTEMKDRAKDAVKYVICDEVKYERREGERPVTALEMISNLFKIPIHGNFYIEQENKGAENSEFTYAHACFHFSFSDSFREGYKESGTLTYQEIFLGDKGVKISKVVEAEVFYNPDNGETCINCPGKNEEYTRSLVENVTFALADIYYIFDQQKSQARHLFAKTPKKKFKTSSDSKPRVLNYIVITNKNKTSETSKRFGLKDVKWTHSWPVRGHWKRYPKNALPINRGKRYWVEGYIKGKGDLTDKIRIVL